MSFWLRTVLSWLLAAALPMQGVAAATLLHCSQGGASAGQAAAADGATAPAAMAGMHHHHHAMTSAAAPSQSEARTAPGEPKCSVCAACCVAAALPVAMLGFEATAPAGFFPAAMTRVDPVFLTGGPERPPRSQPD